MRAFVRYLLLTLAILLLLNWLLPGWVAVRYPRSLGPAFSPDIRLSYQAQIQKEKPQVVLLGNSVINSGIDLPLFEQLVDRKAIKFSAPGTASAYWYLLMKNNIVTSEPPPRFLVIFFLDNLLTSPALGVNGPAYQSLIDEVAGDNESVLLQKAYWSQISPLERILETHLPVFGERTSLVEKIDNRLKYSLPLLLQQCDKTCLDADLDKTFTQGNMLQDTFAQTGMNADPYSGWDWDFSSLVNTSFLPDIIRMAQEKNIRLIFIREKNARVMNLSDESADMRRYFQQLADYFSQQGLPYLDFAHNSSLTIDLFRDRMHLTPAGREIFTRLVAQELTSLIK